MSKIMNWFDVYEFSSLRCCVSLNTGKEQEFWGGGQGGSLDTIYKIYKNVNQKKVTWMEGRISTRQEKHVIGPFKVPKMNEDGYCLVQIHLEKEYFV